ncbi:MAG: hypothetical protein HQ478_04455 [Chloroflexi bacterium]|nr:hypothetical protein [Chloroflexota bacterium]
MRIAVLLTAVSIFAIACGSDSEGTAPVVVATEASADVEPAEEREEPRTLQESLEQYPRHNDDESGFGVILGTPDLGVGQNRVAFVMTDNDFGIVKTPFARVETFFVPKSGETEGPVESVTAQFFDFPLKVRGLYVSNLNLDREGTWEINVTVPDTSGERVGIRFPVEVAAKPKSVALGAKVPPTSNGTLSDVASVFELTTASQPDNSLYDAKIDDLVAAGTPFVVTFASPAFCTNALCGPQVEVLSEVGAEFGDLAEYVHIDLYENPDEIKGDLSRGQRTSILKDWGVHTDEWTFIVDGKGEVIAKFEAFVPREELSAAVQKYLGAGV